MALGRRCSELGVALEHAPGSPSTAESSRVTVIVVMWAVILASSFAQAVSGFGFAMIAIPLLIPVVGAKSAVVIVTVLSGVLTLGASLGDRAHVQWRPVGILSVAALCGIPVGVLILVLVDPALLTIGIGAVVIIATLLVGRHMSPRRHGTGILAGAGFTSGVLLSSTGINGPPVVMAFQSSGVAPRQFRSNLQAAFLIQDALACAGFAVVGQLDGKTLLLAAAAVPCLAGGWWLGDRVFDRISPRVFRRATLAMLLLSGILAIAHAVAQLA